MRKIDTCAPILPNAYWTATQELALVSSHPSGPTDLDARLHVMDMIDGYQQIISLGGTPASAAMARQTGIDLVRLGNDSLAELVSRYRYRFPGFIAALPVSSLDAALAEAFRAVKTLGALGFQLPATVGGDGIDHPNYVPLFSACHGLDVPLFLHSPNSVDRKIPALQTRLILSGLLDDLPGIKIVSDHLGAFTQFAQGRAQGIGGSPQRQNLKKPHAEYFRDFYADTSRNLTADTMLRGLAYHPRDRILFAVCAPLGTDKNRDHIEAAIRRVEELTIETDWKEDIFWRNAAKIMDIDGRSAATVGRRLA